MTSVGGLEHDRLLTRVRERLADAGAEPTPGRVAAALRQESGALHGDVQLLSVLRTLQGELVGAGPLEPLLHDPQVTDVLVNGPDEVWVDSGDGLRRAEVRFADEQAVRRLAARLAAGAGRRLDDAQPWVDATLADGTRLHAVLPPVSAGGTCISLRTMRRTAFDLDELVTRGSLPGQGASALSDLIGARVAFLVSGGTGSGKTTLLSSLLGHVAPAERLVLVEDTGELYPAHPHVVRLLTRSPNVEGAGEVTLGQLIRQALRMRPDRIVVGEVRGPEVRDLLVALNTGHEGGCGTLHANTATDVPVRLEALGALAGLARGAVHSQVAAAVQAVVHVDRAADGRRRVAEVRLLTVGTDGVLRAELALAFRPAGMLAGPAEPRLRSLLCRRGMRADYVLLPDHAVTNDPPR